MKDTYPQQVKIVEVGPRDGLQNEPNHLPTKTKAELVQRLAAAGLQHIEVGSFVSPNAVPQLADADELFALLQRTPGVSYSALTPNTAGMQRALAAKVDAVAVFTAVSETFTQKNIHCSIAESVQRFMPVIALAQQANIPVRGYISCALGCPYEGFIEPARVVNLSVQLLQAGCYEVSIGDTIGIGTIRSVDRLFSALLQKIPATQLAAHFHDTRGQALANILQALQMGIATLDSSVAGLGGCPIAVGATGNVATEDLVYLLEGLEITTGIDLTALIKTGKWISRILGRHNQSKVGNASEY